MAREHARQPNRVPDLLFGEVAGDKDKPARL